MEFLGCSSHVNKHKDSWRVSLVLFQVNFNNVHEKFTTSRQPENEKIELLPNIISGAYTQRSYDIASQVKKTE